MISLGRVGVMVAACAVACAAFGRTVCVTTEADVVDPDDGRLSLREVINGFNALETVPKLGESYVIAFSNGVRKITLGAQLVVSNGLHTLVVDGGQYADDVTLDGGGNVRLFVLRSNCTLKHLTLTNGYATDAAAHAGGAVRVEPGCITFVAEDCAFLENYVSCASKISGESVCAYGDAKGTSRTTFTRCTFSQDKAIVSQTAWGGVRDILYNASRVLAFEDCAIALAVTTASDTTSTSSGVSLRTAFTAANAGTMLPGHPEVPYVLSFADALFDASGKATVSLNGDTALACSNAIVIAGRTDGRRVTLSVSNCGKKGAAFTVSDAGTLTLRDLAADLSVSTYVRNVSAACPTNGVFILSTGGVCLERCAFTGSGSKNGAVLAAGGSGTSFVDACSFTGEKCGIVTARGANRVRLVNVTFSGITARELGYYGVVDLVTSDAMLVNTTMTDCRGHWGGINDWVDGATNGLQLVNSVILNNKNDKGESADVHCSTNTGGWFSTLGTMVNAYTASKFTNCVTVAPSALSTVFDGTLRSAARAGSDLAYLRLRRGGPADRTGTYVYHAADWSSVVVVPSVIHPTNKCLVVGTSFGDAPFILNEDIAGRPLYNDALTLYAGVAAPDHPVSPGSYATMRDFELLDPGHVAVNTWTDDGLVALLHAPYDGTYSLREAIDYAQLNPTWRDAQGRCVITFAESLFAGTAQGTIPWTLDAIDLVCFTNGELRICGPTVSGRRVTFDGQGKYRLFTVGAGNRVSFSDLVFTNAAASAGIHDPGVGAGGAIYNAGMLTVSNCTFASCTAGARVGLGHATGGALQTASGATSLVVRCTFEHCTAGAGGAVANAASGVVTCVSSTFRANTAQGAASVTAACGGAVYAAQHATRTALVNCTLTENAAASRGGGVYADVTAATNAVGLYLLNAVIVGNTAGTAGGDGYVAGRAAVQTSWLGFVNDADDTVRWQADRAVTRFGQLPADVFADWTADGRAVAAYQTAGGVAHAYHALRSDVANIGAYVSRYGDWEDVWSGASAGACTTSLWPVVTAAHAGSAAAWTLDALGQAVSAKPHVGAAATFRAPSKPVPSGSSDPLHATDAASFTAALAYAVTHRAAYAAGSAVTVTVEGNPTMTLSEETEVALFSEDVPLRIVGPATLVMSEAVNRRLFTVRAGNALILENLTLQGGRHPAYGGAAYVEGGILLATGCTFRACSALNGTETEPGVFTLDGQGGGWGGAVALCSAEDGTLPTVTFRGCAFCACQVVSGTYPGLGRDVYQDEALSAATFYNCTFDGAQTPAANDIEVAPAARTEKADGTKNYFGAIALAVSDAQKGDTVVRLSGDAPAEITVPDGVTFRDDAAVKSETFLAAAVSAMSAALTAGGRNYLTAARVGNVVTAQVNEQAVPVLSDDAAHVDLTGRDDVVTVVPSNVKPLLWYGLGYSATPSGAYEVETWVQADADGNLPSALTAPKAGTSGFYRVTVRESLTEINQGEEE